MSFKWSTEEEHLLKLLRSTSSYSEISSEISKRFMQRVPGFRHLRTVEAIRKKCDRDNITAESCSNYSSTKNEFVERWTQLTDMQKDFTSASVARTRGLVGEENIARKILSISDIHFPFARNNLLKMIIEQHKDADIVVINGDMLEGYAASTFEKGKRISSLIEYRCAFEFVNILRQLFPAVYIVGGNHDIRTGRNLKEHGFQKERTQILRPDLLARIANGEYLDETGLLTHKLDFNNVHYQQRESWYIRIGKTIFAHPHGKGGAAPGFTVSKVNKFFSNRYAEDEYDSIVIGHTHKIYKGVVNSKLLVEQGCLAGVMDYAFSPRLQYGTDNGMNGYAVIYQDKDGNTDFNWSGPVFLGEVFPPKKDVLA